MTGRAAGVSADLRRWRPSVQVIPDRVPDEPGANPAVGRAKSVNKTENARPFAILRQNRLQSGGVVHQWC